MYIWKVYGYIQIGLVYVSFLFILKCLHEFKLFCAVIGRWTRERYETSEVVRRYAPNVRVEGEAFQCLYIYSCKKGRVLFNTFQHHKKY